MISSRPVIHADFMTETHRVSCRVTAGPTGLLALLNDSNTSVVDVHDAYFSRLADPARIVSRFENTHLQKANICLVVLPRREDLGPPGLARGGYSRMLAVPILVATSLFEVQGEVEVVHKFDASELLVGGTARFLPVYAATAVASLHPDTPYTGGVILVNRQLVSVMAPASRGKA
jgi:hypothetical protein